MKTKPCGCEEPVMTKDDMSWTINRIMCKVHAEAYRKKKNL